MADTETTRPNVLLICTDHWPASLMGCAGLDAVMTPTLDQIARNGVRFPNAYSECPVCVPARRTLMTALQPHSHGMLSNNAMPMPEVPTMAQSFRNAGYQAYAVGKLHVTPQRDRIGFDDVLLDEEGRGHEGIGADDYEMYLADMGHAGERFVHGMGNNAYVWRPWHLPEQMHVTNWATRNMCRQIIRRDPRRPSFWYLSYSHPHPPINPPQAYLDMYRDVDVPDAYVGDWADGDVDQLPVAIQREIQMLLNHGRDHSPSQLRQIRRAFYAACTHIDHQIRVVIGQLRQERVLNNTIICFVADHGDMLGNHRLFAKHWMYEDSACVPMLLMGTEQQSRDGTVGHHRVDHRLVGLADVMPTLLSLAGIAPPSHCEGVSMVGEQKHEYLYGAWGAGTMGEGATSTRMIRDNRYKLVYYPQGNLVQLFDIENDRHEMRDLANDPAHAEIRKRLEKLLVGRLQGDELNWTKDGELIGVEGVRLEPQPNRALSGQRGYHMPTPSGGKVQW